VGLAEAVAVESGASTRVTVSSRGIVKMGPRALKAGLWIGAVPDVAACVAPELAMDLHHGAAAQFAHRDGPGLPSVLAQDTIMVRCSHSSLAI
jgi:hypothetical protein